MQISLNRCIAVACIVLSSIITGFAQPSAEPALPTQFLNTLPAPRDTVATNAKMDWWRKARFGMFIHWGVYSVPAGVYHGRNVDGLGEWLMQDAHIPRAEYAGFAKKFAPKDYDAEKWVLLARAAGMKYIVITAKHHDGFALFGSQASTWNIVDASPYGKDLLMPLVKACRKYGMKIGFYYSQANDWYNPGGAAANGHWDPTQTTQTMDEYIDKVAVPQVKEILTRYGDVAELWWDVPSDMTPERAAKLKAVLSLQPGIIINDRLGGDVPGDITTPEQYVPATGIPGRDWETCMTINDTWGFKTNDTHWKSTETIVRNLVDIASKGGNYLLNVGPDADGRFPDAITVRLQAVGRWMDKYGQSVYGTSASPFPYLPWGRCTTRPALDPATQPAAAGTTLYFHVFDWPKDGHLLVGGLKNTVLSATMMSDHKPVPVTATEDGLVLDLPAQPTDSLVSVIEIKVKGAVTPPEYIIKAGSGGSFDLMPQLATIDNPGQGESARVEGGDETNIGYWTDASSTVTWKIKVPAAGSYTVKAKMSTEHENSGFTVQVGDQTLQGRLYDTGSYGTYKELQLGRISFPGPGTYIVRISPDQATWQAINVRQLQIEKAL